MYLYVLDLTTNVILFHGAFPDRFELRPLTPTVKDVVTGDFVLPQVLEAAKSNPEGGFVEYFFDDPSDDTDSADIPKVGFAREFAGTVLRPDGSTIPLNFIVGSGFYGSSPAGGPAMTSGCSDRNIAASAVRTQSDIRAFVNCAAEYLAQHGTAEARRASSSPCSFTYSAAHCTNARSSDCVRTAAAVTKLSAQRGPAAAGPAGYPAPTSSGTPCATTRLRKPAFGWYAPVIGL